MQDKLPDECRPTHDLEGVVCAFDVDNTLTCLGADAYAQTLRAFLNLRDLGLPLDEACRLYEAVRRRGGDGFFEHLGLHGALHYRGHPEALAIFLLSYACTPELRRLIGLTEVQQDWHRTTTQRHGVAYALWRAFGPPDCFTLEMEFRRGLRRDDRVHRLVEEARRVAQLPEVCAWAQQYEACARAAEQQVDLLTPLERLRARGAHCVVISQGYYDVQTAKLAEKGLAEFFAGRVLVTERAPRIPGLEELEAELDRRLEQREELWDAQRDRDLTPLWTCAFLARQWASKTPYFYARCLHALHCAPENPEQALRDTRMADRDAWIAHPLRFVMIGDRPRTDINPVGRLLGPGAGLKVLLRQGKYAREEPDPYAPGARPRHLCGTFLRPSKRPAPNSEPHLLPNFTFDDWDALGKFLTRDLTTEQVPPISACPRLLPREHLPPDLAETWATSEFEAVRTIAALAQIC